MNISIIDIESLANKLFISYGKKRNIVNDSIKVKLLTQEKSMTMTKLFTSLSKVRDVYCTKDDDILIKNDDKFLLASNNLFEISEKMFIDAIDKKIYNFNKYNYNMPRSFRSLLSYDKTENPMMKVIYFKLGPNNTSTMVFYCMANEKGLKIECRFD